jgi:hypothetical protein
MEWLFGFVMAAALLVITVGAAALIWSVVLTIWREGM